MTDLNARLAKLSPEKRALLMQQLRKQTANNNKNQIGKRERPERIPLSYSQQRLWFLDQLEPGSATYNVPNAMWIHGTPDIEVLQKTLTEIVSRHEVLRTVYRSDDNGPYQWVLDVEQVIIDCKDLSNLSTIEAELEAQRLATAEASRAFDLANGPIIRACLFSVTAEKHLFILNAHHIAVDGWSYNIIFSELCELYQAFSQGAESPLSELEIQYIDYSLWQQELLADGSETLNKQLSYWQDKLSGQLPVLELSGDRPRPAIQSYKGDVICQKVPAAIYNEVKRLSKEHGVTTFMTFAAAFQVLLSRYSGQEDIILGVGVANRRRHELESLIGFFVNTLALRVDLSGNPSFVELLKRVKEDMLAADEHQDLPVERLLDVLEVDRSMSHSPLFQAMLFFQNYPATDIELQGLTISPTEPGSINAGVSRADLSIFASEDESGLAMYFEYSTDLFDAETMQTMACHMVELFKSVVSNPMQNITRLNLLTEQERQCLVDWNDTVEPVSQVPLIHQLVAEQAATSAEAIAINYKSQSVTYSELEKQANILARNLVHAGVKPGDRVGLFLNRTPNVLVGLLGILKTGAAYIPLDPNYPADRLQFMLEDAEVKTVVTENDLIELVPNVKADLVVVEQLTQELNVTLPEQIDPNTTAYIIFTSGTTGKPKGVLIPHSAVVNFLQSMAKAPGMSSKDKICAVTTLSFDIAVLELLLPLTVGAQIELVDGAIAADGNALAELINQSRATMMQATPTTWRMLLEAGWQRLPGNAFKILSGGEPLSSELAEKLLGNSDELWNMYGPTETTIWSTIEKVTSADHITVGKPIDNTHIVILDNNNQLVPIGVPGELCIGGTGVALGYLKRPELTADKFIANPVNTNLEHAGETIYRTGDLARWNREGRIEVVGRIDHQVKLRGFRIELGEIESIIANQPQVVRTVVVCREDRPGDKRLVAYIISEDNANFDTVGLKQAIRAALPEYMLPSAFVMMTEFPVTPNGKIDRLQLPKPDLSDMAQQEYVAPTSEEEQQLAELFARVLDLPRVSIHDDFFDLGGHSLLATQLITQIQNHFSCDVTLRSLFEYPTVSGFAEMLMQQQLDQLAEGDLANLLDQIDGLTDDDLESLLAAEEL